MTNPAVFYNKEDQWEVPAIEGGERSRSAMQPYYTIMKLPGEESAEFIQMLPFTPRRKDNLAAWMVARSDGEHYGRLLVFQFPKQKVVFGPRQVVARINQDQVISPQITLWNQQGSQVIQGTLLVIPIEESLIYIRPLYLRSAGRTDSGAEARHRRLPEPDRDGDDARGRARSPVRCRRRGGPAPRQRRTGSGSDRRRGRCARPGAGRASGWRRAPRAGAARPRRRGACRLPARPRCAAPGELGRVPERRSSASAMCCSGWRRRGSERLARGASARAHTTRRHAVTSTV